MHRTKSSKNITVAILKQKYHIQTPKKLGKKKTSFNHERKAIFLLTRRAKSEENISQSFNCFYKNSSLYHLVI